MTLTVTEMRDHVETDLIDSALQRIINAEDKSIDKRVGTLTSLTEVLLASGLEIVMTKRPVNSITSISERATAESDLVALSANDYRLLGNRLIRRLNSGDNPASWWGTEVTIAYDPTQNSALRDRILIDLVKLAVEFRGLDKEKVGDWEGEQASYAARKDEVLAELDDRLKVA